MPLFKCTKCHHEWEGANCMCDWCGAIGEILEEKTPLEKSIEYLLEDKDKIMKMKWCDCKEKVVLEKGDSSFIAYESWCPKHGYYTSCYMCNPDPDVFTTETCRRDHSLYHQRLNKLEDKIFGRNQNDSD